MQRGRRASGQTSSLILNVPAMFSGSVHAPSMPPPYLVEGIQSLINEIYCSRLSPRFEIHQQVRYKHDELCIYLHVSLSQTITTDTSTESTANQTLMC